MSWSRKQDRRTRAGKGGFYTAPSKVKRMWVRRDRMKWRVVERRQDWESVPKLWSHRHWGIWDWL